jgi:hypothetical protein
METMNAGDAGYSGALEFKTGTTAAGNSGKVSVTTGLAVAGRSGAIEMAVGSGDSGTGGDFSMIAGNTNQANAAGGILSIKGGTGLNAGAGGTGGAVSVSGGQADGRSVLGGAVKISGGLNNNDAGYTGGKVEILAGYSKFSSSGDLALATMNAATNGVSGQVRFLRERSERKRRVRGGGAPYLCM